MRVHLPKLRDRQKEFFAKAKKFNVLVLHRRAGKTVGSLLYLLTKALGKKGHYGYIAPTYKQAKNIAFDMLKKFTNDIPKTDVNIAELKITLLNGSKIQLFGADNPDSLRGLDLAGVIFDEYSQQPPNIYSEIIYPMLVVNDGFAIWIGTPKGKNAFFDLYQKALNDEHYNAMLYTVNDTGILNDLQLQEAKKEMTDEEFEQEFMCSWNASIKGAYYAKELAKARNEGRIQKGIYDKLLPVYTFWDIGVSDYTAIVFAQVYANEIRIIDYLQDNGKGFDYYAQVLQNRGYFYRTHYFPHDIQVREFSTGISRLEVAEQLFGIDKVDITPKISLKDGIEALRLIFSKLYIEESCEYLINALNNYSQERDDKKGMFKDKPNHDWSSHCADAMRYLAVNFRDLTTSSGGGASIDGMELGF